MSAETPEMPNPAGPVRPARLREIFWFLKDVVGFGPSQALRRFRDYEHVRKTGAFDAEFYAAQAGGPGFSPAMLLRHYLTIGHTQGLDPSKAFSTRKYLDFYPDVQEQGVNPYSHYLRHGQAEHRIALPSFGNLPAGGACFIEDRHMHPWPVARKPQIDAEQLGPYDIRPDDSVIREGRSGAAFLGRFALESSSADFAGAVAELNRLAARDTAEKPDASIILPIYGQLAYTLNCLHSLLNHSSAYSFEILIGDDQSPDESPTWLPRIQGVHYHLHPDNLGFIGNCNRVAEQARGKYLVFLNNDTRVVAGWLDALLDSFERFPKAGMVGSKLFYPDGSLQEAGGIVWRDGTAWNYGRGDDPNRPRYGYAREVDYVSGCSIAVPRAAWQEMNGFDPFFAPAYCEDVDLCFRLRQAGYETWYQSQSRVIHYEGKTSGRDVRFGVKSYQTSNMLKLYERWMSVLQAHRANGEAPWLERDRKIDKRVLVIDSVNPTPWRDAGSLAVANLFRYYQALGYQVSFVPGNFLYEPRAVSEMQASGVQCFYAPFEHSLSDLLRKHDQMFDVVHVIRADEAYKSYDLIRTLAPGAMAIYQNCDLHYLRMQRQAAVENRRDLEVEAEKMKVRELQLCRDYDLTITHSDAERTILQAELPGEPVVVMPLIEAVVSSDAPFAARMDIMFLGGYAHPPNVDAANWLLDEIWPRLADRLPNARLLLVGAEPPPSVKARASDRIIVTGMVDDLAPWFARTRLFLAALRYGAGVKGKVLAALAHGVPVVATDIAAEGLPLENEKGVLVANTVDEIVESTLRLYALDAPAWKKQSGMAQAYIRRNHSFDTGVRLLGDILAAGPKAERT